ncbi:hypothetical protein HCY71_07235 [Limosilactobacillus fermentum]
MNDFEKAQSVMIEKKYTFEAMSQASGASIPTLKAYRSNPDKLKSAKWEVVHKLADMYGKELYKAINDETVVYLVQQYFSVIGGGDEKKNTVNKWQMFFQFDRIIIKYRGEVVAIVNPKGQLVGKLAYAAEAASIVSEYNPKVSYANFDAERVDSMTFDDLAFAKELETYQKIVSQKTKIENKLYDALKKWAETADSTPSEPGQGVVLTYQANDGTLSFWQDFYKDDFEDLPNVEVKDDQLYRNGGQLEDLVEAEEALGYDKIAGVLLDQVKSSPDYNEENAKNFIEYLGK